MIQERRQPANYQEIAMSAGDSSIRAVLPAVDGNDSKKATWRKLKNSVYDYAIVDSKVSTQRIEETAQPR